MHLLHRLAFLVMILLPLVAAAAEPKPVKQKKLPRPYRHPALAGILRPVQDLVLTDLQKQQIADLETRYTSLLAQADSKATHAVPEEVRKARATAGKEGKKQGLKGAELQAAIDAAGTLTDDQKAAIKAAQAEARALQAEFLTMLRGLLQPAQQVVLPEPGKGKKKG